LLNDNHLGTALNRARCRCGRRPHHQCPSIAPLTRRERAEKSQKRDVFTKFGGQVRAVLDALLAKYQDEGVLNLSRT
jgi:hypothetical protein